MADSGVTMEIKGMDELIKKLEELGKMSKVHAGMKAAMIHLKGKVNTYPDKTEANVPKHFVGGRWYERSWGSKRFTKKGVKGPKTSERLDTAWTTSYDKVKFEAVIGNDASYAKYVQGPKGTQAKAMKRIGWKGIDVVSNEETKRVQEYVFDAVMRAIKA